MEEISIGLLAFCNGRQFVLDSLDGEAKGLFSLKAKKTAVNGITMYSPVITNISDGEIVFNKAFVSVILPPGPYEAFTQYNKWSNENQGSWLPLEGRGIILNTANGRTTEGNSPYLAMRMIGAQDGIAFHVLPLGDWRIRAMPLPVSNHEPKIRVDLGISDEMLAYKLAPGECWALPEVIVHRFFDFEQASSDLHRFLRKVFKPQFKRLPVEYNTWLDLYEKLDIERLRRQLAVAKKVGCEVFVVDAGWFGAGEWWRSVGDWREKEDCAFFGNMAGFADEVRAAGLGFGFWIEPERFREDVPVVKTHPEWFSRGDAGFSINLEIPAAYKYLKKTIFDLVKKYKAVYLKTDMNGGLGIDESGAAHYRYARLFYKLMDELRAAFPELVLECCASGALRTDLEAFKHFDVFFPSDNSNPFTQTDTFIGFWRRFLPMKLMRWITLRELKTELPPLRGERQTMLLAPTEGTWEEAFAVDLESVLSASFISGQYGFTGDLASFSKGSLALVSKYVKLFKKVRPLMDETDGYCLMDTPSFKVLELTFHSTALLLVQYVSSEQQYPRTIIPRKLDAGSSYEIQGKRYQGEELMKSGFQFTPGSKGQHNKWRAELVWIEKK